MVKYIKISKYISIVLYWNKELTPLQKNKGAFYIHKFSNARDCHIYLGPLCLGIEELRDTHFRPVRLSKQGEIK